MNDGSATECLFYGTPSDIEPAKLVRSVEAVVEDPQ
jgi:hypothetical protein